MSLWSDIEDKNGMIKVRKEDNIPCCLTFILCGSGTKLPKRFSVPANIRVQRILLYFTTDTVDFTAKTFPMKKFITAVPLAWTYKVREKNIKEFDQMVNDLEEVFGEFRYIVKEGHNKLNDESKKMVEELKKRLKEYNKGVCGIPLWTVDRDEPFPQ